MPYLDEAASGAFWLAGSGGSLNMSGSDWVGFDAASVTGTPVAAPSLGALAAVGCGLPSTAVPITWNLSSLDISFLDDRFELVTAFSVWLRLFTCPSKQPIYKTSHGNLTTKKVKVAHTWLPSVGFRSWSRFLAVSLQVTWVINPVVGCYNFLPGLQLPPQPLRRPLPILLLTIMPCYDQFTTVV